MRQRPRWWDDLSSGNRQKSDEMCSSSKPHCAQLQPQWLQRMSRSSRLLVAS